MDIEKLSNPTNRISPKFYLYLIQYYYLKKKIDDEGIFTLYFYLIHMSDKGNPALRNDFLLELVKDFGSYIGIPLFASMSELVWYLFSSVSDRYIKFKLSEDDVSDYREFKKDLWRYIANDSNILYDEKYRIFN